MKIERNLTKKKMPDLSYWDRAPAAKTWTRLSNDGQNTSLLINLLDGQEKYGDLIAQKMSPYLLEKSFSLQDNYILATFKLTKEHPSYFKAAKNCLRFISFDELLNFLEI